MYLMFCMAKRKEQKSSGSAAALTHKTTPLLPLHFLQVSTMKSALSLLLAPAVVSASVLHASCDVTYEFDADCAQVSATLAGFIQGKDGWRDPKGGDYVLQGTPLPDLVQGTRTTASGEYTDDFEFNLSASGMPLWGGGGGNRRCCCCCCCL